MPHKHQKLNFNNLKNKTMKPKFITSVTFIVIGNMLLTYNSIGSGWTTYLTALFGLIMFFIGLVRMKSFLDEKGKNGVSKLIWATILGIIATVFSSIPFLGFLLIPVTVILNLIAFILQIVGLVNLKKSKMLGETGAKGVNYLLFAMVFMVIGNIFGIIPFAGNFIKPAISFIAFILIPFGWLNIQTGIILYFGIKQNSSADTVQNNQNQITNIFCPDCGKKQNGPYIGEFCEECGAKL